MQTPLWAPWDIQLIIKDWINHFLRHLNHKIVITWVHMMEGKEEKSWFEKILDSSLESAAPCSPGDTMRILSFCIFDNVCEANVCIFLVPSLSSTE